MKSPDYIEPTFTVVYEEDKNNFIELINAGRDEYYLSHCRYDMKDYTKRFKSIHQALIGHGLMKYGYTSQKIDFILDMILQ